MDGSMRRDHGRDMANVDFDKTHLYGAGALRTVDDLKRVSES